MDDAAIIALFFARDERAILETRVRYGGYCRSIAYNLLGSAPDAEECTSDALHAAWESIPPEKPNSLRVYLGRLTRNAAISRYRSEHAKKRTVPAGELARELEACLPVRDSAEAFADSDELAGLLNSWLSGLTPKERALFVLRYWHGYEVSELAKRTGGSPERISQILYRLKKRLKTFLTDEGVEL